MCICHDERDSMMMEKEKQQPGRLMVSEFRAGGGHLSTESRRISSLSV